MTMQVKAVYENGVLRPLQRVKLAEQQEVTVAIAEQSADVLDSGEQTLFALRRWNSRRTW